MKPPSKRFEKKATPLQSGYKPADWMKSVGGFIAGQAHLDECDKLAARIEKQYGAGRLRMHLSVELRIKFDRQRYLLNNAIFYGTLQEVELQAERMQKAWRSAEREAIANGIEPITPNVWEIALDNGRALALCRTTDDANAYSQADGRSVEVWSLEEVARMVEANLFVSETKRQFPGAKVERVKASTPDPLDGIATSANMLDDKLAFQKLDDEIPF